MKILFDHPVPFSLAHGGLQVQIEQTKMALLAAGVDVEYSRWWDAQQRCDLIHCFSPVRADYLKMARLRGLPVIVTPVLSETCNRSSWHLRLQAAATRLILAAPFFGGVKEQLAWSSYRNCSHLIVGLHAEKEVLTKVYGIEQSRISVVPLGVSEAYLAAKRDGNKGDYLISTGTITRVKGSVELARLARSAQVPVLFVGKPYDPADPYWREFHSMVDDQWVRYQPHVETQAEMIRLLQGSRGFVLLSRYENWSLAASEAVACGLPLLLRDQRWARERFADTVCYVDSRRKVSAEKLREFYQAAPNLPPPEVKLATWNDVAQQLLAIYTAVLSTSR